MAAGGPETPTSSDVVVIGAGLAGACTALALARSGLRTTIIERDPAPMRRASLRNEGKIHLGLIYAAEASAATALRQLDGALSFRRTLRDLTGPAFDRLPIARAFVYLVDNQSLMAPDQLAEHYALLERECATRFAADSRSDYLGHRPDPLAWPLTRDESWIGNSNDLMSRATGDFMFFAFHDDLVEPTHVERLTHALMQDPGAVLAYSDLEQRQADGETVIWRWTALEGRGALDRVRRMAERPRAWRVPNRGVFRSSAFHRIGGLKRHEQGEFAADLPWLTHMACLGRFVRVPEILCRKRYMAQSLTKVWRRGPDVFEALLRSVEREILASDLGRAEKHALVLYLRARRRYPKAVERAKSPARAVMRRLRG